MHEESPFYVYLCVSQLYIVTQRRIRLCPLVYNGNFKCLFIIVLNINVGAATTGTGLIERLCFRSLLETDQSGIFRWSGGVAFS